MDVGGGVAGDALRRSERAESESTSWRPTTPPETGERLDDASTDGSDFNHADDFAFSLSSSFSSFSSPPSNPKTRRRWTPAVATPAPSPLSPSPSRFRPRRPSPATPAPFRYFRGASLARPPRGGRRRRRRRSRGVASSAGTPPPPVRRPALHASSDAFGVFRGERSRSSGSGVAHPRRRRRTVSLSLAAVRSSTASTVRRRMIDPSIGRSGLVGGETLVHPVPLAAFPRSQTTEATLNAPAPAAWAAAPRRGTPPNPPAGAFHSRARIRALGCSGVRVRQPPRGLLNPADLRREA